MSFDPIVSSETDHSNPGVIALSSNDTSGVEPIEIPMPNNDGGWGWDPNEPVPISGGGGPGSGAGGIWGILLGYILDKVGDVIVDAGENYAAREARIANSFNPHQIDAHIVDIQGHRGVVLVDGTTYFDMNNNGLMDLAMKSDPTGRVWVDKGNGWELLPG